MEGSSDLLWAAPHLRLESQFIAGPEAQLSLCSGRTKYLLLSTTDVSVESHAITDLLSLHLRSLYDLPVTQLPTYDDPVQKSPV